jgi:putative Mg2+ transporter-C (MgtC) family protein
MIPEPHLVVRICVGTLLGSVIGYERDIHGRPAGLRTHALVALASSTFMAVSTQMAYYQSYHSGDLIEVDPSRIAASVVSGIGFLAGGAILRTGLTVQGLTTAAGLWLVAAIGLAAGGGMYVASVAATVIGIITLTLLRRFEDKDDATVHRKLSLTLTEAALNQAELVARIEALGARVVIEGWEKDRGDATRRLAFSVHLPRQDGEERLLALLDAEPGVKRMQIESPS